MPEGAYSAIGGGDDTPAAVASPTARRRALKDRSYRQPLDERVRFLQLTIGGFSCICASTGFVFNLFSQDLQGKYNYTQSQMTTISTIGDVLGSFTLPFGFLYDYHGAKPIFLIGLTLYPLGSVLFGLAFANALPGSVPLFSFFASLQSVGTSMFDLAAVMTLMSIFPSNRGAVVAVMKTLTGVGAAIIGVIYLAFFDEKPSQFFYFLAMLVSIVGFLAVIFIEVPPYQITGYQKTFMTEQEKRYNLLRKRVYLRQRPPARRFVVGFIVVMALIIFLPVQGMLVAHLRLDHSWKVWFAVTTIVILSFYTVMAMPLSFLDADRERTTSIIEGLLTADEPETTDDDASESGEERSLLPGSPVAAGHEGGHHDALSPVAADGVANRSALKRQSSYNELDFIAPQYTTTFTENLRTARLWAIFWTFFCITGAQAVVIANARFLYAALAEAPIESGFATLLTVIQGVGSGLGRMIMSYLEMKTQKRPANKRIPITYALFLPTGCVVCMLLMFLILPYVPSSLLVVPFALTALGNGFTAAALVIVLRTIFAEDPAKHYNFCFLSALASSIVLNRYLYGEWYTYKAHQHHEAAIAAGDVNHQPNLCYGQDCLIVPVSIMLLLNVSALVSSLYVHVDYVRYSKKKLAERTAQMEKDMNYDP